MLPNLIIIGAQKCATTSLHYYLNLHPQISMSREKELHFFIQERNWHKGIEWYKSNFTGKVMVHGESSPDYTTYPFYSGVPERMYSVLPDVKLIYILRDPIDRMISHYVHRYAIGKEGKKITGVFKNQNYHSYVCRSKYFMQLEQYLKFYPKSSILIITMEDLYRHRQQTLKKVFNFLNVDETFYSRRFSHNRHKSIYKRHKNRLGYTCHGFLE